MDNNANNGRLLWSQRSNENTRQLSWADETQWTVPFVLSPEATHDLAQLAPDAAKARLHNWLHAALSARSTRGPVRGSSYGAASWGVNTVEYVHGAPCGAAVVYQSVGIGD